jgi:outer membrane receptor protein involved in Fe transport
MMLVPVIVSARPSITLTAPPAGQLLYGLQPTIVVGYSTDAPDQPLDLDSLRVSVNGADWTVKFTKRATMARYTVTGPDAFTPGTVTVRASIADGAGVSAVVEQAYDVVTAESPRFKTLVVVSADHAAELAQRPASVSEVTHETLEARGAQTLPDALGFLPGVEVADGDDGPKGAGVTFWGLREFTNFGLVVDGVPVGGTFAPNTAFVPIEDVDRIEAQKGPSGVLFGQAAFGGLVQVFTKTGTAGTRGFLGVTGGSLGSLGASGSLESVSGRRLFRLCFLADHSDGWQPRAGDHQERLELSYAKTLASGGLLRITGRALDRWQGFGSPIPREGDGPSPRVPVDQNYAVTDAEVADRIAMATFFLSQPLRPNLSLVNVTSAAFNSQSQIRGYLTSVNPVASAVGSSLAPDQVDLLQDLHVEWRAPWGGHASLLQAGISYSFGRIEAEPRSFSYQVSLSRPQPPASTELESEETETVNLRHFAGLFLDEQLVVNRKLILSGGARLDWTNEHARVGGDAEAGDTGPAVVDDGATHLSLSYKAAATLLLSGESDRYTNLFASLNHAVKPAPVNFGDPEDAQAILEPERATAFEAGVKVGGAGRRAQLEASLFQMNFTNLAVSQVRDGLVVFVNGGEQRFRGFEVSGRFAPLKARPFWLSASYALHRPIFLHFQTATPEGELQVLDGKTLELAAKHLVTAQIEYGSDHGLRFFAGIRAAGDRPLNRMNTAFGGSYCALDAGVSQALGRFRLILSGLNLTDSRHIVGESELSDAQFYLSPPRRFLVNVRADF